MKKRILCPNLRKMPKKKTTKKTLYLMNLKARKTMKMNAIPSFLTNLRGEKYISKFRRPHP